VVYVRGENRRVSQHTIYVALGVNLDGKKKLLGLWLSQNEGAKLWLSCLTDLKNRGLSDFFVACIDGLSGFADAIHAGCPRTKVQLCIVHLVRAALRYVSTEDARHREEGRGGLGERCLVSPNFRNIRGAAAPLNQHARNNQATFNSLTSQRQNSISR